MNIFLENFISKKFKKPGMALDLGCGKGYDVACLKSIGWKVFGVDKHITDLNKPYDHGKKVDLVYSNYVLQFISRKNVFIKTCYDNLKDEGILFIHTFSRKDKIFKEKGFKDEEIINLLEKYFKNIKIEERCAYDNNFNHKHWHKILEITAQKK